METHLHIGTYYLHKLLGVHVAFCCLQVLPVLLVSFHKLTGTVMNGLCSHIASGVGG